MRLPHDKYIPDGITKRRESGTNTVGKTYPGFIQLTQGKQSKALGLETHKCALNIQETEAGGSP